MALVRCEEHPPDNKKSKEPYVRSVPAKGGEDTALICGRCYNPAVIWLTENESRDYDRGERIFHLKTATVRVKAE